MSASLTEWSLARWAAALPAESYDVRLVPASGGRPTLRRLDAAALGRSAGWLRAMDAAGHHVYGRPLDARHVLVDDLDADGLAALQRAHTPAAVVQTSPGCHQAWVTVSAGKVEPPLATAVARELARQLSGDPGAASYCQLGRLPGLANRKAVHERSDGTFPWARLLRASPGVDLAGMQLLAQLSLPPPAAVASGHAAVGTRTLGLTLAAASSREEWQEASRRIAAWLPVGTVLDRSRVDLAVARRLLARGATWSRAVDVVLASDRTHGLSRRQALHYAERTVAAASRRVER